mmetsp:Transcript_37267/g.89301  ORF Transcript_37267/g.89301 Transcript_37267/m.89301 type:complete len:799 (+) Transcript_37267:100-2496(+)
MASIAAAANKPSNDRRLSDQVRLNTGHMLTFDDLAHREGVAEKHVFYRILERRITTNTQLMSLPLSLMYFMFYVTAYYMHEDINNVYFVESTIRMHADNMFRDVQTIDELWNQIEGPFVNTFFVQQDYEGNLLNRSLDENDRWGLLGRVDTYNQLQGAVRFMSTRQSLDPYGTTPWVCDSMKSCELCRTNTGFQRTGDLVEDDHNCGSWGLANQSSARRLDLYRPELDGTMKDPTPNTADHFIFYLYPGDDQVDIRDTLRYFRERGWIDYETDNMQIQFYLVNCELGRCRLEQVQFMFRFSQGGGVYYKRLLIPIFLELFSGAKNMMVDAAFFFVWLVTSCFRILLAWRAFLHSELFSHITDPLNVFEVFVVLAGLLVAGVVGLFWLIAQSCRECLKPVRELGWSINSSNQAVIEDMFTTITEWATMLENARMVGNFFAIVLMFRFFINFGAQPRLRVVTRTLAVVLNDLVHFGLVFVPVILAYMCSGTIMFGRNFFTFTTVKAAMGSSFRIMMESEYDWGAWTEEYYWYTGIWTWIFMFMVVLVMLNMVLAIILDIYNEVREKTGAKSAETILTTVFNVIVRVVYFRRWVSDRKMLKAVAKAPHLQGSIIAMEDIKAMFPNITDTQLRILFTDCRREMNAEAERDLDNKSLLQATGTLMRNLDKANKHMNRVNVEEAQDPIHLWTSPTVSKTSASAALTGGGTHDTFMTQLSHSKGTKNPNILDPDQVRVATTEPEQGHPRIRNQPPWLVEVHDALDSQSKWLKHAHWQLKQMEWQMHIGHMSKYGDLCATGKSTAL